jgi:hypothetical protein
MSRIKNVIGRRVWDSRGWPTVEVEVHLENGLFGRGMAPAGASCGMHEAVELRDGGSVLSGKDVQKALHNIQHEIAPALIGTDINDQKLIDSILIELDGTGTFSRLGATPRSPAPWRLSMPRLTMPTCRCGSIWQAIGKWRCRCRKFRFSAAVRTPGGVSIFRI